MNMNIFLRKQQLIARERQKEDIVEFDVKLVDPCACTNKIV